LWQLGFLPTPDLVKVSSGSFKMGGESFFDDAKPIHVVRIQQDFYMATTEATFEQYDAYVWAMQ